MKRCVQCHRKLGLGVRSRNFWDGRWWVHTRFCSAHCELVYVRKPPPNSVGRLSSLAAIREPTVAVELTDCYLAAAPCGGARRANAVKRLIVIRLETKRERLNQLHRRQSPIRVYYGEVALRGARRTAKERIENAQQD